MTTYADLLAGTAEQIRIGAGPQLGIATSIVPTLVSKSR